MMDGRRYCPRIVYKTGLLLMLTLMVPSVTYSASASSIPTPIPSQTVPGKVQDLQVTYVGSNSVGLSWKPPANTSYMTGYAVFAYIDGACYEAIYNTCPPGQPVYSKHLCHINTGGNAECNDVVLVNMTSIPSYTQYIFNVVSTNKFILSDSTTVQVNTTVGTIGSGSRANYTYQAARSCGYPGAGSPEFLSSVQDERAYSSNPLFNNEVPGPVSEVQGSALNSSAVLVQWKIPHHMAGPTDYTIRVLEAANRTSFTTYTPIANYTVNGYNSSSCVVSGLLSSWRYRFNVSSRTSVGMSSENRSSTVTTLESSPDVVQNLTVSYVNNRYMAVLVSWDCPLERKRNGHISKYTVEYAGNVSLSLSSGKYYPEDPCTDRHNAYLPIVPNTRYNISVFANAEYVGKYSSVNFYADLNNMNYLMPSISNRTVTDKDRLVTLSAVGGVFIFVLLVMNVLIFIFKVRK